MSNQELSAREERRYKSQIALKGIGKKGQELLKNAKVLVIGAGGKGTTALKNLITAGIGNVGICDDRLVQEDTLSRQSLYGDNDIGKQKAIVSKQYLKARNQFTDIKVHNIRLTEDNLHKIINDYDVLVDATNNSEIHFTIANAAHETNIPVVFGAIINNKSILKVLNVKTNQRLSDFFPNNKPIEIEGEDSITPVVIINTLTGVFLANEVVKIILGLPSQLCDNLLIISASDYSLRLQPV